jgi:nucleoside-diphosphate-sugar epimerase
MRRILLTGATGFVGRHLCARLAGAPYILRAALRVPVAAPVGFAESAVVGSIDAQTDWGSALRDVDVVIHAAARAHRPDDTAVEPYLEVNARGTQRLAAAAAQAGVTRFIYLSSVKVNGEGRADRPYRTGDAPHPGDVYANSKWLGERYLWEMSGSSTVQPVVMRAPLVYGPEVKGNFLRLLRWVDEARLLPLGAVQNRRSLVSVWTLCDLLVCVLEHPAAVNRTWMVSDGEDISAPDLVRRLAHALNRPARLLSIPPSLLRLAGDLLGRGADVRRLCDSLTVDIAPTRELLGWSPPLSMHEALARTVSWYRTAVRGPQ